MPHIGAASKAKLATGKLRRRTRIRDLRQAAARELMSSLLRTDGRQSRFTYKEVAAFRSFDRGGVDNDHLDYLTIPSN